MARLFSVLPPRTSRNGPGTNHSTPHHKSARQEGTRVARLLPTNLCVYVCSVSNTYTVERSTTIKASPGEVYSYVADLHKMGLWSPWERLDPNMTQTYSGPETGVGSRYTWSGNRKVGEGSMEITALVENQRVDMDLEFIKPFKAKNKVSMTLEPNEHGTAVTWAMTGRKTLMTKMMGIFRSMDAMVGPDFEKGLASLKEVVGA